ncbi:uncharacterized protein SPSK_04162 [Sporothrix schenckii 1099-18]|uniref:Alternative oxidase n=2 Tax=Sporothrix schenckii TaxID=29908 RepID=U7PTU7_SPOS1|nr:uncharacterized protein SPSK_04162 [Sporothrix schenckii 1099-18]ERS99007.1 hypothetical protein HMPREF1624_04202 [Sporothrix schenckii ATCC 58251]KJR83342.1 hypothetical protein SPSK_04162 [Sporothrix schenckii 1099-18]
METVDAVTAQIALGTSWAYDFVRTHASSFSYQRLAQDSPPSPSDSVQRESYAARSRKEKPFLRLATPSRRWLALTSMAVALLLMCWATGVFVGRKLHTDPFAEARRRLTKDEYIDAVMRNPVEGLVDVAPIQNRCRMVVQKPGLVWHCDYTQGGLGNLGNFWVGCMLFGIESGATTIVLPRVGMRDDNNLINNGNRGNTTDMSLLYDLDYFMETWREACPQVRVVHSADEVPNLEGGRALTPHQIPGLEIVRLTVVDIGSWRVLFEDWLARHTKPEDLAALSPDKPLRVLGKGLLFAWHRASMDQQFAFAFTRMFRFKPSLRRLGAAALWGLEQKTGQPIVSEAILFPDLYADIYGPPIRQPLFTPTRPPPQRANVSLINHLEPGRVLPHSFMGAHLRADSDAAKMHWPGYDAQAPVYLHEAVQRNLTTIYLAAGTPASVAKFKADAAPHNLTVYTKEDVLADDDDVAAYQTLTWDGHAVIDFQVLLYSSYFTGFGQSTFSMTLALRRSSMPDAGPNQVNPWRPFTNASFEMHRDNLSSVICGLHGQTMDMMWP